MTEEGTKTHRMMTTSLQALAPRAIGLDFFCAHYTSPTLK